MVELVKEKDKKFLLQLARDAIRYYFDTNEVIEPDLSAMPFELSRDRGVFVTLYIGDDLRGCIGYIDPIKEIWRGVVENAINAAFHDTRFKALKKEEFDKINIEISVLSDLEPIAYVDGPDLFEKIEEGTGIVIRRGMASGTYLPDVWSQFKDKKDFLSSLCEKIGLKHDAWLREILKVYSYKTNTFSEEHD